MDQIRRNEARLEERLDKFDSRIDEITMTLNALDDRADGLARISHLGSLSDSLAGEITDLKSDISDVAHAIDMSKFKDCA